MRDRRNLSVMGLLPLPPGGGVGERRMLLTLFLNETVII